MWATPMVASYMDDKSLVRWACTSRFFWERIRDSDVLWWERFRAQRYYWSVHLPERVCPRPDTQTADAQWEVTERNWQLLGSYLSWRERYRLYWTAASKMTLQYAVIETSSHSPIPRVISWQRRTPTEEAEEHENESRPYRYECTHHWVYRAPTSPDVDSIDVKETDKGKGTFTSDDTTTREVYSFVDRPDTVHCIHAVLVYFGDRSAAARRCVADHTRHLYRLSSRSPITPLPVSFSTLTSISADDASSSSSSSLTCPTSSSSGDAYIHHDPLRYTCVRSVGTVFREDPTSLDSHLLYYHWTIKGKKLIQGRVELDLLTSERLSSRELFLKEYHHFVFQACQSASSLGIVCTARYGSSYLLDPHTFTPMVEVSHDDFSLIGLCGTQLYSFIGCSACHRRLPSSQIPCYKCRWLPRLTSSSLYVSPVPLPSNTLPGFETEEWKGWCGRYPAWFMRPRNLEMTPTATVRCPPADEIEILLHRLRRSRTYTDLPKDVKRPRLSPP